VLALVNQELIAGESFLVNNQREGKLGSGQHINTKNIKNGHKTELIPVLIFLKLTVIRTVSF
jgi:hypothetical protein